jgi:hypothetical protein
MEEADVKKNQQAEGFLWKKNATPLVCRLF